MNRLNIGHYVIGREGIQNKISLNFFIFITISPFAGVEYPVGWVDDPALQASVGWAKAQRCPTALKELLGFVRSAHPTWLSRSVAEDLDGHGLNGKAVGSGQRVPRELRLTRVKRARGDQETCLAGHKPPTSPLGDTEGRVQRTGDFR